MPISVLRGTVVSPDTLHKMLHSLRAMRISAFVIVILICPSLVAGAEAAEQTESDYQIILNMQTYSDAAVGIAGVTPESVQAFRRLVKRDNAGVLFRRLIKEARPAGQLYALCGLYFTDKPAFEASLPQFRNSGITVTTQYGCMIGQETVANLVSKSGSRVMDLKPGQSPMEWLSSHPEAEKEGFEIDIAGGGFCHVIRGTL